MKNELEWDSGVNDSFYPKFYVVNLDIRINYPQDSVCGNTLFVLYCYIHVLF